MPKFDPTAAERLFYCSCYCSLEKPSQDALDRMIKAEKEQHQKDCLV